MNDDTTSLTKLGETVPRDAPPTLETFPNLYPSRPYVVTYTTKEFTSLCPKTGQPDFAEVEIRYQPAGSCVETKSLKLYLAAFRSVGMFMESITNKILEDFVSACSPHYCEVRSTFASRGGIETTVSAEHGSWRLDD